MAQLRPGNQPNLPGPPGAPKNSNSRLRLALLIGAQVLFVAIFLVPLLRNLSGQPALDVPYSFFKTQLADGNVDSITLQGHDVTGQFKIAEIYGSQPSNKQFATRVPDIGDAQLQQQITDQRVTENVKAASSGLLSGILLNVLPLVAFAAVWLWILRRSGRATQGIFDFGRSRARLQLPTAPKTTFNDVAGVEQAVFELQEIVEFLRDPNKFQRLGGRMPKGVLLIGPPGTGKTLLARAVAGEAGVPFFSISASEFVEMFVGVGASRVRDLFNQARQSSPCVVFIDEIDAVGRKRSVRVTGSDERDQTLNQLLVELDGFDTRQTVVVLAATNRVDILDKALLRPGRFDRHINVSLPDRVGREAILKVHTRKTPLHEEVSLARLSRMTTGMSGADLANLVNEAALSAARRNLDCLTHDCFEEALARVQLGALRPLVMNERERRIIAFHEGAHALVAPHLPLADKVNRVTILPRGQSLGVTQFIAEEDRYNYSRETLMARIAVGLGGRVAEELTLGPERVTTGAENDLQVVTDLARRMVTRWGMSEQVGVVFADHRSELAGTGLNMIGVDVPAQARSLVADANGRLLLKGGSVPASHQAFAMISPTSPAASSASMAALIDAEVQRILNEGREIARTILSEHYDQLTLLAEKLMEHEQLDRAQF